MAEELPKHELLIKLMGMTGSSNDAEALVALRKANELLASAGWDWERVLRGKISVKVFEDPFKNTSMPKPKAAGSPPTKKAPSPPPRKPVNPPQSYQTGDTRPVYGGIEVFDGNSWVFRPTRRPAAPPPKPPKAPPGPNTFTKYADGRWVIKSPTALNEGRTTDISKRDGSVVQEHVGAFIEQDHEGYFLYRIGSKQRARFADQLNINDLL